MTTSDANATASDAGRRRDASVVSGPDESADATVGGAPAGDAPGARDGDSSSLTDKLDTAGTIIWTGFLAAIVVFTLIPVVGLAAGYAPFAPPETTPYFALVGTAFVGTVVLVGGAILDA
ncbi:hypothetical protein [Halorussus pelagicus]|uniref:hypothetical protein n=1 Tax=Halorussus pelagicus TaxID=2505977 RepID=UPI000FFC6839|nr:hypothetical protein [Halorussus pelagicus]